MIRISMKQGFFCLKGRRCYCGLCVLYAELNDLGKDYCDTSMYCTITQVILQHCGQVYF